MVSASVGTYYNATSAAKILGCSRSSVCRAAKNYHIGIFTNGRLAAIAQNDLTLIKEKIHETSGNPLWIAARGQKVSKAKRQRKAH